MERIRGMATREYSPEEIQSRLIEISRANFYEISWNVRKQIALDFIAKHQSASASDVLDCLEDFEDRHLCQLEIVSSSKDSAIGEQHFYTGNVNVTLSADDSSNVKNQIQLSRSRRYGEEISKLVKENKFGPFDTVAELGAGYGLNLFRLSDYFSPPPRYIAAEISAAGRDFCGNLNDLEGAKIVEPQPFDHREPDLSFVGGAQSLLLITCHSIEQVQFLPQDYFGLLTAAAPRVVGIHFEPFGFQADTSTDRLQRHREFIHAHGFNEDFYNRLNEAERDGHLRIKKIELEKLDHQYENPTSMAVWTNF